VDESPNIKAQADSLIGTKLDDRYEIISAIASGGMGVVYRGRHILMDKIVAIKMLNAAFSNEPDAYARFQNEAKIACQLSHPNIVTVHDFGIVAEKMYLVMDFVEGKTLGDLLDDETFLPVSRVTSIALQICDALQYAHEQELIHRDLKAENIMIVPTKDGHEQVKILDFGLAKFFGEGKQQQLSASGFMMGTAYYMSPEQCRGKRADVRSEIYSLACVLHEALTGVPPFVGENVLETVQKHIDETALPVSQVRPELEIPQEMEAIITRGLDKNPDKRFQSAAEFKSALERLKLGGASGNTFTPIESPSTDGSPATSPAISTATSPHPRAVSIANEVSYPQSKLAVPFLVFLIIGVVVGVFMMFLYPDHLAPGKKTTKVQVAKSSPDWVKHYKAAVVAFDDEKYDDAEKSLNLAVLEARHSGNNIELLQSLKKQQDVLYVQRKFKDADALDSEIMRLATSTASDEPGTNVEQATSNSKQAQANVSTPDKKSDDASTSTAASIDTNKSQAERIAKLAMFCHERGQCGTAIKLLEHSVEVSKRMHGVNSLKTAERIQELASLHIALDENDKAQPLLEQVMEIKATIAKKKQQ
jgi:serine/threonine protein kinase